LKKKNGSGRDLKSLKKYPKKIQNHWILFINLHAQCVRLNLAKEKKRKEERKKKVVKEQRELKEDTKKRELKEDTKKRALKKSLINKFFQE